MRNFIKNFDFLGTALVIVICAAVMVGCQNTETKKVETETTMPADHNMGHMDTLPPLDTSSASSTKPETIKNQ